MIPIDTRKKIIQAHKKGESISNLAKKYKISRTSTYNVLRENKLLDDGHIAAQAFELFDKSYLVNDVVEFLKISPEKIQGYYDHWCKNSDKLLEYKNRLRIIMNHLSEKCTEYSECPKCKFCLFTGRWKINGVPANEYLFGDID